MAWIVCSECSSEFPLAQIEQYVQHKLTKCRESAANVSEEADFCCGYCIEKFNTSLALMLHVSKHDVKVGVSLSRGRSKAHIRRNAHRNHDHEHEETSCDCDSEMESDSCCDYDEDSANGYCNHSKVVGQEQNVVTNGTDGAKGSETIVSGTMEGSHKCSTLGHKAPSEVSTESAPGKQHSSSHGGSHHHVKRHACAQTACTAFEQKSHCCCVDLNGQVTRLVSLGIIKLPNCCEPPAAKAHHHCASIHRSHSHHDNAVRQEDGTQTQETAVAAPVKQERSSPCTCTNGCERCTRRNRADGECQTEFEWVDLDVDFDVDALLDGPAPESRRPRDRPESSDPATLLPLSLPAAPQYQFLDTSLELRTSRLPGPHVAGQSVLAHDSGMSFVQDSANMQLASLPSQHGKVFQCGQCGREFKQAIHLRKHNWSLHSNDGKPYKCPLTSTGECSYASVEKTHLQAHIRTHTGEKPYKCKYCDYAGKQSSTLRSHMLHKHPQEMLSERQLTGLSPKHY